MSQETGTSNQREYMNGDLKVEIFIILLDTSNNSSSQQGHIQTTLEVTD